MHPLDGPRLKIRRAKSQLDAFRRAEQGFWKKSGYKAVKAEFNPKTQKDVYRVSIKVWPTQEFSIPIGEMAHNLRSALDGLVYQLALLNPKTKTPARSTQFPIFLWGYTRRKDQWGNRLPQFYGEGKRLGQGERMIKELLPQHQAIIEGLQPYKRIGRSHDNRRGLGFARSHPLYLLSEINNADKHRLIQVVGFLPTGLMWGGWTDLVEHPVYTRRPVVLKDGAKLCEFSPNVNVQSKLIPLIAFSEGCEAVKNLIVVSTFYSIIEEVSKIVESFSPEFE